MMQPMAVVKTSVTQACRLTLGENTPPISAFWYVAVDLVSLRAACFDYTGRLSVARLQCLQETNTDPRRHTLQKSNHNCKVCKSYRSLCGGLPSRESVVLSRHMFMPKLNHSPTDRSRRQIRPVTWVIAGLLGRMRSTTPTLGSSGP